MTDRIVLRKGPGPAFEEVGTLLADAASEWTVQLADGSVAQLPKSGHPAVLRGGVNHVLRAYPGLMARVFEQQPQSVVNQLLQEAAKPQGSADIKRRLQSDLGVDSAEIDKHWAALLRYLKSSDSISAHGSKPVRYLWRGPRSSPGLLQRFLEPSGPEQPASRASVPSAQSPVDQGDATKPAAHPSDLTTPDAPRTTAQAVNPGLSSSEIGEHQPGLSRAEVSSQSSSDLAALLRSLGGPRDLTHTRDVAAHLLRCGRALSTLTDEDLGPLLDVSEAEKATVTALLATLPKRNRLLDQRNLHLDDATAADVLQGAIGEIGRASGSERQELSKPFANLANRTLGPPAPAAVPAALVGRVLSTLSTHAPGEDKVRDRVASVLASQLREDDMGEATQFASSDLRHIARAVKDLPVEGRSGRTLLIAAIYRVNPEALRHPAWWTDLTFEQAVEGSATLSAALLDDHISQTHVAPLVRRFLSSASSRSAWSQLFGAPPELARHVTGQEIRAAWERISGADEVARLWLDIVSDRSTLETLQRREMAAVAESQRSAEGRAAAEAQLDHSELELERMTTELRAMREEAHTASEAHDRQVKLDVVTTLANLAISVLQSPKARQDVSLVQTLEYLTGREGLAPLESAGQRVAYRPTVHDSLGQSLEPGSPVSVVRPGYTYASEKEEIVLIKAQVGPA